MKKNTYKFELEPLPYGMSDLLPYISEDLLYYHHDKHLKAYVDNLNKALENYPEYHNWTLRELLYNLEELPTEIQNAVRNNAGGVYNHNLYFAIMSKDSKGPQGELLDAIIRDFGSTEEMLNMLKAAGTGIFGSGWAYIVSDKDGKLSIFTTANQDTPVPYDFYTILPVDVWEHAYYLQYQNLRADYLEQFVNVINWEKVYDLYVNRGKNDY